MSLYDILACPVCKTGVESQDEYLRCTQCGRKFPVIRGVPVMFPDWDGSNIEHESELSVRERYDPWVNRLIMQSLADDQVVVDFGCGNMKVDDPCVIRMDVRLTPYVDVVGDAHAMPFKPSSVDFFFALAVFEHLRNPCRVTDEIFEALKPGGYVYGDCNFVFPYHGYPHHYYNATLHGMKDIFARFRQLRLGVAPFQMPSFALDGLITTYLSMFTPENDSERDFVALLRKAQQYPLRYYDTKFGPEQAFRIAAGTYCVGIKQPTGTESLVPAPVMKIYATSPELQKRFPDPVDLTVADNIMLWAMGEGSRLHPEIAAYFQNLTPFSKYTDPSRTRDRWIIRGYDIPPSCGHRAIVSQQEIERYRHGNGNGNGKASTPKASPPRRKRGPFYKWKTRVRATLRA